MKISNETKVGVLGAITITILILGFNFLKGNKLFTKSILLNARYTNIQGLTASNPVVINGLEVGRVQDISTDKNMKEILVKLSIYSDVNIPSNSVAIINPNPLTVTKVEIRLGDAGTFLQNNDNINTLPSGEYLSNVINKVDPVIASVTKAIDQLDSLIGAVKNVIDKDNRNNISAVISHINDITVSLQALLDKDKGPLAKTLNNANDITANLSKNNQKINSIIDNLDKTSGKISELDLKTTLGNLNETITQLKATIEKVNSNSGTAGMLINDPTLYKNISSTSNKINLLLDDIRVHPKRYINISVFGKKQTEAPLSTPTPDSLNAPYIKN